MKNPFIFFTVFYAFIGLSCHGQKKFYNSEKINGITLVAPSRPVGDSVFVRLKQSNAAWVALVPYGFQRDTSATVFGGGNNKWWGESEEGVRACVKMAKKQGLRVMLKPQVWIRGGWVGKVDFNEESKWIEWERSYKVYLDIYIKVAIEENVEMFCIGTEYDIAVQKRKSFWLSMIKEYRKSYQGKLVYSANWDNFEKVPFWNELDYVGISGYYPLSDEALPTVELLEKKWSKYKNMFSKYANKYGKQILFTEYGYLTTEKCASRTWELESKINELKVDQQCQANALEALYKSLWNEPFFAGGFLWKWYPSMGNDSYNRRANFEERRTKDYDPKDKLGEEIIKKYYSQKQNVPK